MLYSIIKKEWLKTKFIVLCIFILALFMLVNFWYNLNFSFATIEPESMMWYRFTSLEQKPYEYFFYLYLLISVLIAIFQFIPEKIKNRIKIMSHLPISLTKSIFLHLFIGFFYILLLSLIITVAIVFILSIYYPQEIIYISLKDISFYFLGSIISYLGLSSVIIEKRNLIAILKLFITILSVFVFFKTSFTSLDLLWLFVCFTMFFLVLDSFYSIKEQRLENPLFRIFAFISVLIILYFSYTLYINKYKHEFNKYYIFYSTILKKFVYQKNFGDHRFEYGIKGEKTFDRVEYESYLPFVYWRNLDIQKKLPLDVEGKSFDKKTIKSSRLSFSYHPSLLKKQEVQMYPLINPQSKIGMIRFPEEMIAIKNKTIKIYDFDEKLNKELSNELKKLLEKEKVTFPIKNIWGKATNMKPFDLGYFLLDSKDKLFRLNRYDNKIHLEKVPYPKNIKLKFIKISENKKRKLAGFAIDSQNSFYLIDYKTFEFKKIELKNFDYKKMRLLFISNAKYYLVRYTNEKKYYAVVFNKNLQKIDEEIFE